MSGVSGWGVGPGGTVEQGAGGSQQVVAGGEGGGGGKERDGEGRGRGGAGREGEVEAVAASLRGMLSLAEDSADDWAFLKDFLGLRPPHVRDSETGELTTLRPHLAHTAHPTQLPPPALPAPQVVPQLSPASPAPPAPPQGLSGSPLPPPSTPLPSISTLVRSTVAPTPTPSPCLTAPGPDSLGGHLPPLTPEEGLSEVPFAGDPCQTSAFRSVTPQDPRDPEDTKPSSSLLRDLLVLGKPPRAHHDQVTHSLARSHSHWPFSHFFPIRSCPALSC